MYDKELYDRLSSDCIDQSEKNLRKKDSDNKNILQYLINT